MNKYIPQKSMDVITIALCNRGQSLSVKGGPCYLQASPDKKSNATLVCSELSSRESLNVVLIEDSKSAILSELDENWEIPDMALKEKKNSIQMKIQAC